MARTLVSSSIFSPAKILTSQDLNLFGFMTYNNCKKIRRNGLKMNTIFPKKQIAKLK